MSEAADLSEHVGLPKYDDGREYEISFSDGKVVSLTDLEQGRTVTVRDDKGREITFRVGTMTTTSVQDGSGIRREVPYLTVIDLRGDGLNGEQVNPGLYVKNEGLNITLYPPREEG